MAKIIAAIGDFWSITTPVAPYNTTGNASESTALPFNRTHVLYNNTRNGTSLKPSFNATLVSNATDTLTTVFSSDPPTTTEETLGFRRLCTPGTERVYCMKNQGACVELMATGQQACRCACGWIGDRCQHRDFLEYFTVCTRRYAQSGESDTRHIPTEYVLMGFTLNIIILLLVAWLVYWRVSRYKYKILKLERRLLNLGSLQRTQQDPRCHLNRAFEEDGWSMQGVEIHDTSTVQDGSRRTWEHADLMIQPPANELRGNESREESGNTERQTTSRGHSSCVSPDETRGHEKAQRHDLTWSTKGS